MHSGTQDRRLQVSRRYLALYLALVGVPTAVFAYLSYYSIQRQLKAVTFSSRKADFAEIGRRAASDIEKRVQSLAVACLQDPALSNLAAQTRSAKTPTDVQRIYDEIANSASRHEVARHVFLVRNGSVLYPELRPPTKQSVAEYAARFPSPSTARFVKLISDGDRQADAPDAIQFYGNAYRLPVAGELRALALQRLALAQQRAKLTRAADQTYRQLTDSYGAMLDPSYTPYSVAALLAKDRASTAELQKLQSDIEYGSYQLTSSQTRDILAHIRKDLGPDAAPVQRSRFISRMDLADELQASMQRRNSLFANKIFGASKGVQAGDIFAYAFSSPDETYQSFFVVLSSERGREVFWGFTADLDWVQASIAQPLGLGRDFDVVFKGSTAPSASRISFEDTFPFWELVPTSSYMRRRAEFADFFVLSSSLILMTLIAIGFHLVHRNVARDRELNVMRQEFINGVSHELKTPITLVRLFSETLLEDPALTGQQRESCEVITREAVRLEHLVQGILEASPIDRGLKRYQMNVCDIESVLAPSLNAVQRYLELKGFVLSVYISPGMPPISVDAEAARSAVLNLIDNAVKYSGQSNVVRVHISATARAVVVEVRDEGIGVPPEERENIFQPYHRVNNGISRGGCGLGLFLVRHIMAAHNGRVELDSEVGRGSVFRLIFPLLECGTPSADKVPMIGATSRVARDPV